MSITGQDQTLADPIAPNRLNSGLIGAVRVAVALMWIQGAGWKVPPRFGDGDSPSGLRRWTEFAITHEVFAPYTWVVDNIVLPNFVIFGWGVLIVEASLGAFILVGLLTRFWAIIGFFQTGAIILSAMNAPNEWPWAYVFMLLLHVALFATAAGRHYGLDGVLRPDWQRSDRLPAKMAVRAS